MSLNVMLFCTKLLHDGYEKQIMSREVQYFEKVAIF